jgi:lipopolysaccharide/colanic/teichoic acid biosynthesis glycosyltransferase
MRTYRGDEANGRGSQELVTWDLFKGILTRERRRSDRSNQPFVLLVLGLAEGRASDSPVILEDVIGVLAGTIRQTDIAGWVEGEARIGIILSEIRPSDVSIACKAIEARIRRALADRALVETLTRLSIGFHIYPEPPCSGQGGSWPVDPLLYPELQLGRTRRGTFEAAKRVLDIMVSLALLTVLSPLLLGIATLVKLVSRGSVLFRQVRIGRMMKPFTMLKFRTMYSGADADAKMHEDYVSSFIKAKRPVHDPGANGFFKLTNDPRVTPVGRFLRKTSLDELPQLWNVLWGDMSLVGPRPPLPYEVEQYEPWHRCRLLEATPGITGLWQVAGRSRTTFDEMVRLDLRYARTRSLWTDIKILLATPAAVLSGKGAC